MIKEKAKTFTIIGLTVCLIISITITCSALQKDGTVTTAYIEKALAEEIVNNNDGTIRIKMNPEVTIKNGVMQDLYFANYNETRLLKCKIKVGNEYVYDSGFVQSGDIVVGDFIDVSKLQNGKNEAIAEIYSYDFNERLISQTNVEMNLNN